MIVCVCEKVKTFFLHLGPGHRPSSHSQTQWAETPDNHLGPSRHVTTGTDAKKDTNGTWERSSFFTCFDMNRRNFPHQKHTHTHDWVQQLHTQSAWKTWMCRIADTFIHFRRTLTANRAISAFISKRSRSADLSTPRLIAEPHTLGSTGRHSPKTKTPNTCRRSTLY